MVTERDVVRHAGPRGIHPSFLLRVGSTAMRNLIPSIPETSQDASEWLAFGYMVLYGWEKDPMMDLNDALFELSPYLDQAVAERTCPVWRADQPPFPTCSEWRHVTAESLLHHLSTEHKWPILTLEHWLSRHETRLVMEGDLNLQPTTEQPSTTTL